MQPLILGIVVVATVAILFLAGARVWARTPDQPAMQMVTAQQFNDNTPAEWKPLTRGDIAEKLRRLASDPPPQYLGVYESSNKRGAMCYVRAEPPKTIDYICPIDGSRTQYPIKLFKEIESFRIFDTMRNSLSDLRRIDIKLDSSEFCKKCHPEKKHPKLVLVVKLAGEKKEHRVRGISQDDVVLIRDFLAGKYVHQTRSDNIVTDRAMKDYVPRLQELLGVKIEDLKDPKQNPGKK